LLAILIFCSKISCFEKID